MNDYIARFRVNDFEKQELKEHIREVQKLAAAMGKRVDLRRTVSSKSYILTKKLLWKIRFLLLVCFMILENIVLSFRGLFMKNGDGQRGDRK